MVEKNRGGVRPRLLSTGFVYTLPCQMDIWIYFTARDVSSMFLVDPAFAAYNMDKGKRSDEPINLVYDKEVFDDIEDKAHALIYEGEWEHVEDQRSNGDSSRDQDEDRGDGEGRVRAWEEE